MLKHLKVGERKSREKPGLSLSAGNPLFIKCNCELGILRSKTRDASSKGETGLNADNPLFLTCHM